MTDGFTLDMIRQEYATLRQGVETMIAVQIDDVKAFASQLFVGELFDKFLVREAQIVTFNSFSIDGHIRQGYYTTEELEEKQIEDMSLWAAIKPVCFSLIKGKKLPGSFKIDFQLAPRNVERFMKQCQTILTQEAVNGLYLSVRYENGELSCVTGVSLNVFTLDKLIDREWDEMVRKFLLKHEIAFEEMA